MGRIKFITWTDGPSVLLGILLCARLATRDHRSWIVVALCAAAFLFFLYGMYRLGPHHRLYSYGVLILRLFVISMLVAHLMLTPMLH
jgi:uncharacterized membrane protein YozB (DUF420 family)